uniref:uncharacterized protein LOC101480956 n=2 Tax=Maylandia zebra TaxID=106582 RepID=UPI000D319AA2|nr:uncharacterized protein LOC101480956 [Maylandia zebra]
MVESHGRIPPEHFYDHQSGSGYLAWRLKTVQRNSTEGMKKSKSAFQDSPKTLRNFATNARQLSDDECKEAMSVMRHSTDMKVVKEKMKVTFQHRQKVIQDPATASSVLDLFPRFLDTPGLIDQDFTMLFGEEVSGKFLAKWPTFFKPRIIKDCKNLSQSTELDDLLVSAQGDSDEGVWDCELAAILLLLHLLPPTSKGRKSSKISTSDAAHHLMKFMKVGGSMETFLKAGPTQPFLLCVGERKNIIQTFYIVLDQKVIPCVTQTGVAAFDELFKAHFVFAVSYDEALHNFYTFIQTTVYGIDVGSVKESPRVREIRARILHSTV